MCKNSIKNFAVLEMVKIVKFILYTFNMTKALKYINFDNVRWILGYFALKNQFILVIYL